MTEVKEKHTRISPSWMTRFSAMVKYELLWNIRKKKFLGIIVVAFALTTLSLVVPVIMYNVMGLPIGQNPDYVIGAGTGIGGLAFFLFAVATVMNSISGEFESGSIVPLLTKPISRTTIFLGKLSAAFLTILAAYTVILVYFAIGGTIIYGPQNNLHLTLLPLVGNIFSTFVWIALVLAIGSISKSSLIAALVPFGIWLAFFLIAPIISVFSEQAWILTYMPGTGATGYIKGSTSQTPFVPGMAIATGTDAVGANLINYLLYPSAEVTFFKIRFVGAPQQSPFVELYTETLSFVLLRSILVTITYILVFLFISWFTLKRAQVLE